MAHPGACGKTRVVPHNRRSKPEPTEMGGTEMRVLLSTYGSRGRVEPMGGLGAKVRVCAPADLLPHVAEECDAPGATGVMPIGVWR